MESKILELILISCFSCTIMFLGFRVIDLKLKKYFSLCFSNEKTSLYHDPIIRGIGIIYLFAFIPILFSSSHIFFSKDIFIIFCSTIIGFCDDKYGISQVKKILILIFMILSIEIIFHGYNDINLFLLFFKVILFLFFTLFFNQIDGINGLAGLTFLVCCIGIFLFPGTSINLETIVPLIIIIVIYLNYNFKGNFGIQGEAGSFFMGAIIFVFVDKINNLNENISFILIFLLPVLSDVVATTLIRFYFEKNIFIPHKNHLYQRLVNKTKSHFRVSTSFALIQISIILSIHYLDFYESIYKTPILLSLFALFLIANLRISYLIHNEKF
jgi:UDP-GlcNAc:undecaprenyl-phosphate GlcNAc-1-phosphate transferase